MKITLEINERECSNYFRNVSKDYLTARGLVQIYYEHLGFTVFREIGFVEPEKRKLRAITNLLAKRSHLNQDDIPILDTRAILLFFPHKPYSTAVLIKKIQRVISNWQHAAIFLCYYSGGKRKGEFPVITRRIVAKFDSCYIYSLDLQSQEFRSLYNPLELDSEVKSNANQNTNDKAGGSVRAPSNMGKQV